MRLAGLAAVVVVLAGCNGLVTVDDAGGETVTPAPVPTETARPGGATERPSGCAVPPPATPDRTPAEPATPRTLPVSNGTVDGTALIAIHDRVLSNYSYHLRAGNDARAWVLPNATAFSYQGVVGYRYNRRIYAVGDTLYELEPSGRGENVVIESAYRRDAPDIRWIVSSLSGRGWLENRIGWYEYERAGTLTLNGTRVRVFRAVTTDGRVLPRRDILAVNSTVYVDRRGIVRRVLHRERSRSIVDGREEAPPKWQNETFAVTELGSVEPRRPEAFCRDAGRPAG